MSRGPAPSPSYLRLLKGNPSKRPVNRDEPQPSSGPVEPPEWLVELDIDIAAVEALTVVQLRELARRLEVARAGRLRREALIAAVVESSEGDRLRFWRRLHGELVAMKVLTTADADALGLLCSSLARWVECERVLRSEGLTYPFETKAGSLIEMQRPEVGIANAALMNAIRLMDRFGLDPAYRTKLKVEAAREADALDEMRSRGRDNAG